jgi:anti-sigma factor RsiW
MNCAQAKEQLIDYLYGELSAAARSAFVEHLRGCPGCHAEVAGHERALGHARHALAGPLLQEPPARVRLAVMEAARTQARALRQAERAERPGFFARLLRTPWVLPAFGAVSVATVVFLVRVLKDPEMIPGQRPSPVLEESPPPAAAPVVLPPQARPAEPTAAAPAEPAAAPLRGAKATSALQPREALRHASAAGSGTVGPEPARKTKAANADSLLGGLEAGAGGGKKKGAGSFAEPPPRWAPERKADRLADDVLGSAEDGRSAPAAEVTAAPLRPRAAPSRDEERGYGRPPSMSKPLAAKKESEAELRQASPANLAAPQPEAAPAAAPPPPVAAPAPVYATPPKARRGDLDKKVAEEPAAGEAANHEFSQAKAPLGSRSGPSLDESVRKADRLYASQDWTAAATAYRELLNRFPGHKDSAKWRERMNQSLVAEEQARKSENAKAAKAKAKSSDAALKEMK